MGAVLLKCHKCGRNYAVGNMKFDDAHQCECGSVLKLDSNYIGLCDNVPLYPNMPAEKHVPIGPEHGIGDTTSVCGEKGKEYIYPKYLTKKVKIDVETGNEFHELLKNLEELEECLSNIPGLVMIDSDGKANVTPVISIDSKMIVFKTTVPYRKEDREKLAKEYTDKLGIKCEVIDAKTELVAVIDG